MPRYLDMLRAKNIFGGGPDNRRPLGMPELDNTSVSSMFGQAISRANSMKDDDARRAREMMEFEASLRRRQQAPVAAPMMPVKKNIVYGGVEPNMMQERFHREDAIKRAQQDRLATLSTTQTGALNNALITGKQRDDADMARTVADINGRQDVARTNKEMAAKAADDARTDKATMDAKARLEKGPIMNIPDPKDPTKMISVRHDPSKNRYERIQVDDDTASTSYKPGNIPKPTANPGQDPTVLANVRKTTQSALDELDQLIDPKTDELYQHTSDAVGKSRMIGDSLNYFGAGSMAPSTTKGRAGIDSLKGKLVLDLIGQMKAQSKTGATGFGAMNQKELAILEASASKLANRDMGDDDFKEELKRIRTRLKMIMQDAPGDDKTSGPSGSDADKKADDYMRRKGLM